MAIRSPIELIKHELNKILLEIRLSVMRIIRFLNFYYLSDLPSNYIAKYYATSIVIQISSL